MTGRYVAILDTGGISYSGRVYVAVGKSESDARDAVAVAHLNSGNYLPPAMTRSVVGVAEWYGIRTYGPIEDGAAVEGD